MNALDGCADGWGQIDTADSLGEKVLEGEIGVLAVVVVLEWSQRTVLLLWIEGWKVVRVLNDILEFDIECGR